MKKLLFGLIISTMLLSACGTKLQETIVTKEGTVSTKVGSEYLLNTEDGIVNITSNKVNLDSYMKKTIKVTGMFSGSTLYVDKIEDK